jgi:hypothetical protein
MERKNNEKRTGRLSNLSEVFQLSKEGKTLFSNPSFRFWQLQNKWKNIAGPMIARESYISFEKKQTLYITVTNSVWMNHLYMMKADLLKRIREDDYGKKYTDIRFVAGRAKIERPPESSLAPVNNQREKEEKIYSVPLSEEERNSIDKWTGAYISDTNTRSLFTKMMKAAAAKRKGEIRAGWHSCAVCGDLIPPGINTCTVCENRKEQSQIGKIILLLKETPHLSYNEIYKKIPCKYTAYEEGRETLIQRIRENIYRKIDGPLNKRILLSMILHKPLKDISLREAETALRNMPETKFDIINKK